MTQRRDWLKGAAALGLATQLPAHAQPGQAASAPAPARAWQNWSGSARCQPSQWLLPADEAELARLLPRSTGPLRCVGAGHSFTALVPTPGSLVALDRLSGLVAVDKARGLVRVRAGTRLGQLARLLDAEGLALHNQPDIDVQSLAGALATGTHGTGAELPALHAHVRGLRLVTPAGEVLEITAERDADLLAAAQVSLGALGVVSEFTLAVRPRYMLRRRVWVAPTEELLAQAPELARSHRHFEMFVLPFTGYGAAITHAEVAPGAAEPLHTDDEDLLADLRKLRDWLGRWPELRRWTAAQLVRRAHPEAAQDWSWRLLSTVRPTRFNESEYHLPREQGVACLREIVQTLERRNEVFFPIEFRYVKGDGAWLSPFHGRDSCSVACHAAQGEAHDYLIGELGPVFRHHGGRPHWGKLHDLAAPQLAALYPRFADFQALRRRLDPQDRLLNVHLAQLFGAAHG
ncbi:D-arabinono-1,4-lactone oxidase [Roseateles saccharophilus]|uniref:FAD-linked oxidoreductase n=1 Tax=Roseateles saccharophilus TaxID=304 RepID=A0A4R3UWI7_ROSSA|nr:D-arabinono-1,4-lactone oxidase [Roseateles saccharophilus]MDG0832703.1 FAD-binding protein [Roseateles saccharophilus]TCU95361.1 FAD-linked oxidoreductase [Roseateles saccharophilus]